MSHRHHCAATTHTVELQQVQEINRRLAETGRADVSAGSMGCADRSTTVPVAFPFDVFGTGAPAPQVLRPTATLRYLSTEGSPQFPYLLGHFSAASAGAHWPEEPGLVIELHSDVLQRLSVRRGLRRRATGDRCLLGATGRRGLRATPRWTG